MRIVSTPPSEAPAPARIAPLSVLPVFLDLRGKPALVAGGTDAAAWKAELLAAAGAAVTVAAEALGEAMARLVAAGTVAHAPGPWAPGQLAGAAVALADAEDDGEAAAFAAAARAAGVPCNVIDKPAFCGFQFGSVVNRSPVVVGISTTGAAPILGQAVRRRIETLLPPSLAAWGALAERLRAAVTERLAPPARRRVWEALAARAFGGAPEGGDEAALRALIADAPARGIRGGHVTFVGAGPGEAEHLTLKAVRALQAADVILHDDLVSDEVLELARREARRILVGKRAGRPSCRQEEISALMVSLAEAGRRVVRLKSGDPTVFGRMGEEVAALRARGLPYDVVPGVTAGLALAAELGVSLTHRDAAKSVRLVTAHSKAGGLPGDVDWRAVADPSATTILYMGARTAPEMVARLVAEGLDPLTPAALGVGLGRGGARVERMALRDLPRAIRPGDLGRPVVIGIGRAFAAPAAEAAAEVRRRA